jgi:hypothetical protein
VSRVATLWEEWDLEDFDGDTLGSSASSGGSPDVLTYPTSRLGVSVQLAFGADPSADPTTAFAWTDVTRYVYQADKIRIARGRQDEQSQTPPSRCTLTFNNTDGRFTPRNPTGPYYGTFGRNTPLRVQVNPGTGWVTRFTGFVSEWPPRWDVSENFHYAPVTASGILRRLGQGNARIKSLSRATVDYWSTQSGSDVVAYWPLEDLSSATQVASGLANGTPLTVSGTATFDTETVPSGVATAPNISAARLSGTCNAPLASTSWAIVLYVNCSSTCRVLSWTTTSTTIASWTLDISSTTITLTPSSGSAVTLSTNFADGEWHWVGIQVSNSGSSVSATIFVNGSSSGGSVASSTCGAVSIVNINPDVDADLTSVSHLTVSGSGGLLTDENTMNGIPGRPAGENLARIALYNNVAVDVSSSDQTDTEVMGPFPVGTLLQTFQECADADEGVLTERLDGRLGFDSHLDRENQAVTLAMDYLQKHVNPSLEPTDDDQHTRNDVTVSLNAGSSGRSVDQTGPLGVNSVGRYDEGVTLNLYLDSQAVQHAAYRVAHGTVNEMRYPRVQLNFARNPTLIASWLASDIGSRLTISNPPTDVAPDQIDQIIEGYTEIVDPYVWTAELNCSPFSPNRIFRMAATSGDTNDFLGYLNPTTCVLAEDLDTTETGVDITTTVILWGTAADNWTPGAAIMIGGERMTVTAVSGGSNPQTLTVTRSVNGVVKSHLTGATVAFLFPGVMGL